ncbi:MarR family winged helix-turn-helix transcriptional regulator [Alkalicoccus chagannorensis]|uniref:MarR family winged helix-turn-helix transcriptional regulator n=1 Tax=Alkalicoccus chagannorensis TaxID=427072 RepID=UPI00068457DC|nr:MarR family transcriptional regulator [Alkalicoccus chagannorensis]
MYYGRSDHPDVRARRQRQPENLNAEAAAVTTSLYRAAQQLRLQAEREVLTSRGLSWTTFSMLYDLWMFGAMETSELAASAGVSKATVSNAMKTLEKHAYCVRRRDVRDRRRTFVELTETGTETIASVLPAFHEVEKQFASPLTGEEQEILAGLLTRLGQDAHGRRME